MRMILPKGMSHDYDQSAKEQATVPKPLAADIQDQQTSFVYNSIKTIMVSSFCQGFSLQE